MILNAHRLNDKIFGPARNCSGGTRGARWREG